MAKWQYSYLQRKKAESGQTGTATYDLPEKDYLSALHVIAYRTTSTNTNGPLPVHVIIDKIEVVDGGTVIQSLTGEQVKGLMYYRGGVINFPPTVETASTESYDVFTLHFGLYPHDTKRMLDLSKLSNPQVKITWDASKTDHKGVSYDAISDPSMKFTVVAELYRGSPPGGVQGYVKSSQIYSWTQAASTTTEIEIPRGQPLIGLMINAGYAAKNFTDDVYELKLDLDNGAWVPFHFYADEVINMINTWYPQQVDLAFQRDIKDDITFDTRVGYLSSLQAIAFTDVGKTVNWQSGTKGIGTIGQFDTATPSEDTTWRLTGFQIRGHIPFHNYYIPMKALFDGSVWTLDTTQYSRIVLKVTSSSSASTSSTPSVVAEYLAKQ